MLGGDGTSRIVARHAGECPLCPLSTGTNNAFPACGRRPSPASRPGSWRRGRVRRDGVLRRAKLLRVRVGEREDAALVDVALTSEPWIGARALWRPADIGEVVIAFGEPGSVGLSSIAGAIEPVARCDQHGLHVRLTAPAEAAVVVQVPIVPGLVAPVGIAEWRQVPVGETVVLAAPPGSVALDGERELELPSATTVEVTVDAGGPLVVDVDATMAIASAEGLLRVR